MDLSLKAFRCLPLLWSVTFANFENHDQWIALPPWPQPAIPSYDYYHFESKNRDRGGYDLKPGITNGAGFSPNIPTNYGPIDGNPSQKILPNHGHRGLVLNLNPNDGIGYKFDSKILHDQGGFDLKTGPHLKPGYDAGPAVPRDVMVDVINDLGISLLAIHNEHNDNNMALSPYGAISVLAALSEGLRGEAVHQILHAAHLPKDRHVVRVGLRDIHRHLKSYFIPPEGFLAGLTLNLSNVTLRTDYEDVLKFYGFDYGSFNNALYPEPPTTANPSGTTALLSKSTDSTTKGTTQLGSRSGGEPVETTTVKETTVTSTTTEQTTETTTLKTAETTIKEDTEASETKTEATESTTPLATTLPPTTTTELPKITIIETTTEISQTTMIEKVEETTIKEIPTTTMMATTSEKVVESTTVEVPPETTTEIPIAIETSPQTTPSSPPTTTLVLTTSIPIDIETTTQTTPSSTPTTTLVPTTKESTAFTEITTSITEETTLPAASTTDDLTFPATSTTDDLTLPAASTTDDLTNLNAENQFNELRTTIPPLFFDDLQTTTPLFIGTMPDIPQTTPLPPENQPNFDYYNYQDVNAPPQQPAPNYEEINPGLINNMAPVPQTLAPQNLGQNVDAQLNQPNAGFNNNLGKRQVRSVGEYIQGGYFENTHRHTAGHYLPGDPKTFAIYGKYREPGINFMKYDTVLPFSYLPNLNALALSFPLDSSRYYLLLLLPVEDNGIDQLICELRLQGGIKQIVENLRMTHVVATIPSFMLKGYVSLTPTLQKLGIRDIFEPRRADFSPMTDEKNIYVTNIEQAVTVTIKNYLDPSAEHYKNIQQYDPVYFTADHPFLYFVLDSDLNVALMVGKVVNPLNSRIR